MKRRWILTKGSLAVEADYTDSGRGRLESVRRDMPELFKYGRITDIIQAHPSMIPPLHAYILDGDIIGPVLSIVIAEKIKRAIGGAA